MLVILNLSRGLLSLTSMQHPFFFSGIGAFAIFFFTGSFVFTSESLSLFKGVVSKFRFHVNSNN